MNKSDRTNNSSIRSSQPCAPLFQMFNLFRRPCRFRTTRLRMKTPLPQARILPMRFLTVCKVTATFDPHFDRAQKERLPLLTPTDDYENNDKYYRSDVPCRETPTFLRLCRCRGMRHTGIMVITLTGCVAHRSKQGKRTAPFSRAERFLRSQGDTP